MAASKTTQSKKSWEQQVRELDPEYKTRPTTAYRFSNNRKFRHKRNPYS